MDENEVDLESVLKRFALWGGIALAIVSIYFSYDGADTTINGGNPAYTEIARYIMIVMALAITLAQFIFNSDFTKLSTTLRVVGAASYIYSIYTNYLGIQHLFGFHGFVGIGIALFMDVTPEAFIAWSLDDSLRGDMLGNIGKFFTGAGGRRKPKGQRTFPQETRQEKPQRVESNIFEPKTEPRRISTQHPNQPRKGQGRSFLEQQRSGKVEKPNRFGGFGE